MDKDHVPRRAAYRFAEYASPFNVQIGTKSMGCESCDVLVEHQIIFLFGREIVEALYFSKPKRFRFSVSRALQSFATVNFERLSMEHVSETFEGR